MNNRGRKDVFEERNILLLLLIRNEHRTRRVLHTYKEEFRFDHVCVGGNMTRDLQIFQNHVDEDILIHKDYF